MFNGMVAAKRDSNLLDQFAMKIKQSDAYCIGIDLDAEDVLSGRIDVDQNRFGASFGTLPRDLANQFLFPESADNGTDGGTAKIGQLTNPALRKRSMFPEKAQDHFFVTLANTF